VIDLSAEKMRLAKELEKIAKDKAVLDGRLSNENFVARAPQDVLDESRGLLADLETRKSRLTEALARLN
jgi:valyl-tRNA synthetase